MVFFGRSTCPLCGVPVQESDDLVATSHFVESETDPLWRYSDAAMHRQCFLAWEHRPAFVARYNEIAGRHTWGDGTYKHMTDEGTIVRLPRNPVGMA